MKLMYSRKMSGNYKLMLQNLSGASEAGTVSMGSVVKRKHEIIHSRVQY